MITEEMLDIYTRFKGDIDGFARGGSHKDRSVISDAQWSEIDAFLQELHALKAKLASPKYAADVESRLCAISASERVKEWLWQLA